MGAADIQQWLEEHGGQARDPITDANGITTYVGADGSYITVTKDGTVRLRGFSPPTAGVAPGPAAPASGQTAAPPAADTSASTADAGDAAGATGPLATYTQDQVNARLAEIGQQIGGQPRYVPQQRTKRVPNPAADPSNPATYRYGAPAFIDQPYTVESWYDPRNNTLLFQGQRQADGTFQTTTDAAPRTPQLTATQTAALVPSTPRVEGTPLPGGGFDNSKPIMVRRDQNGQQIGQAEPLSTAERTQWEREKNGGLTDAELRGQQNPASKRTPVEGHPGIVQVTTADPKNPNAVETHYENAQNQVVPTPVDAPKPEKAPDGSYGYWDTSVSPPKWTTVTGPQALQTPVQINGTYGVWKPDPGGGPPTFEPIKQQPGLEATPADAPNLDLSDPKRAYDSFMQLYQWGASKVNRGEKTPQWLVNLIAGPHEALSAVLDREKEMTRRAENTQGNQLTQRSQDISFADNRLSNATQGLQTATSAADKINMLAGPGLHAYSSTLLGTLALQGLQNQALGGTNQPPASVVSGPPIPGPMAQPGAAMPGQGALGQPPGVPNAMVAGGAAVGPVGAGITATNAAAVNPTGANVGAATDATMAGSTAAFGGLGVGPAPSTAPPGLAPPVAPQSSLLPNTGPAPLLAMLGSRLGGDPLAAAKDALRRMGIGEDSIMAGHQDFLNGGV